MYDLLKFIDSAQVRAYNKDTYFTPAEWAVIVASSMTRTVEEKIKALRYLVDHYDEKCFEEESANMEPRSCEYAKTMPSRSDVIQTIHVWEAVLQERYSKKDGIYAAGLMEKDADERPLMEERYRFFHSYEKAYAYLSEKKQELTCKGIPDAGIYGKIECLNVDNRKSGSNDCYLFDRELRLVDVWADMGKWPGQEEDGYASLLNEAPQEYYPIYVPLPFKKGDIIKVESLESTPFYGVMACDWESPEDGRHAEMSLPLDFYYEGIEGGFDYTDGGTNDVLRASLCPEEELPEEEQVLKLISDVRKGKLDFQVLLHKFGRKELGELLKCREGAVRKMGGNAYGEGNDIQ